MNLYMLLGAVSCCYIDVVSGSSFAAFLRGTMELDTAVVIGKR